MKIQLVLIKWISKIVLSKEKSYSNKGSCKYSKVLHKIKKLFGKKFHSKPVYND